MSSITLTPRELELLKLVGRYITTSAVDWAAIAEEANFSAPKKARDMWYPIRNKLFGKEGEAATPASGKKGTPGLKKRKGGDSEGATPSKKKAKKADTPVEDADDEEETKTKPKANGVVKNEPESDEGEFV